METDFSTKEVVPTENFPHVVALEFPNTYDTSKQVVPIENFQISMSSGRHDSDKQVFLPQSEGLIPVETEISTRNSSSTPTASVRKKSSLMSRMKFKMKNHRDEFMSLIQVGELEPIKDALDKGVNININNAEGQTGLVVAILHGKEDVVSLLLDRGTKPDTLGLKGESALSVASRRGYVDIVFLLLLHNANPNIGRNTGKTPLCEAAVSGCLSILGVLLKHGAEPNARCSTGDTALNYAVTATRNSLEMTKLLLDHGADPDNAGRLSRAPLLAAVDKGNVEIVKLLLEFHANPNKPDIRGRSPMSLAMEQGKHEIINLFSKFGYWYRQPNFGYNSGQGFGPAVAVAGGVAGAGFLAGGVLGAFDYF